MRQQIPMVLQTNKNKLNMKQRRIGYHDRSTVSRNNGKDTKSSLISRSQHRLKPTLVLNIMKPMAKPKKQHFIQGWFIHSGILHRTSTWSHLENLKTKDQGTRALGNLPRLNKRGLPFCISWIYTIKQKKGSWVSHPWTIPNFLKKVFLSRYSWDKATKAICAKQKSHCVLVEITK